MTTMQELLDKKFWTQIELADALDVSASTVSRWVDRKSTPRRPYMRQMAEIFDVPVEVIRAIFPEKQEKQLALAGR